MKESSVEQLQISLALSGYDHTRDLVEGHVRVPGIDLVPIELPIEEIFFRVASFRSFDVAEFSFAKYVATRGAGLTDLTAIPVFPSRMFRQSSLYVRSDSPLTSPEELRGRRVGIPEWAQTASVWSRSWLQHEVGIPLEEIEWVQAGVSRPGRREKVPITLPPGVRCQSLPDDTLTDLLLDGTLDAVLSAHPLEPFKKQTGEIALLFRENYREAERDYFSRTGLYPLMHVITVKQQLLDRHPWVAGNLMAAFEESKARSLRRLTDLNASRHPVPWLPDHVRQMEQLFGGDPFPYGLEKNRRTIDMFLSFALEQGLTTHRLDAEAIFAPEALASHTL